MPILTAFQGTVTVEGNTRGSIVSPETPLYKKTITAYGKTIGELIDNLVEASVLIANDVFTWTTINKPENYKLDDDYWYMHLTHPEILETSINDPKTHSKDNDSGSGSSLSSVEFIVKFATLLRDIQIKSAAFSLIRASTGTSEIVDKAAIPYDGIYEREVTSFTEITKFGFTGTELDTILEIAEREGRLKKYRDDLNEYRNYQKRMSSPTSSELKQKWWNRRKEPAAGK